MKKLSNENIARTIGRIEQYLEKKHIAKDELIRTLLTMEEALLRCQEKLGPETPYVVEHADFLRSVRIRICIPGEEFNPFALPGTTDGEERFMHNYLARSRKAPSWNYARGANALLFTIEKKRLPDWTKLVFAIGTGLAIGLLFRAMPDPVRSTAVGGILSPLLDTFLGFLNAIAGPMIFLAVVSGIYNMGDAATFSTMGRKLLTRCLLTLCIVTALVAALSWPFFHLTFGEVRGGNEFSALYHMVLGIVPDNLVMPFATGNSLQILFIAVVVGVSMIVIGEKMQSIASSMEQLSLIVHMVMGRIGGLIPYFVCGSVIRILAESEFGVLSVGAKFVIGTAAACVFLLTLHTAFIAFAEHIPPKTMWQRAMPVFLIAFSTASSVAAFDKNLEVCVEKHGIPKRLASFGIPFCSILYAPGMAAMYWFASVAMAEQGGGVVSPSWIATALLLSVVLTCSTPTVPGGCAASFSILFSQMALPTEYLAVVISLSILLDFVCTATNVFSGECMLLMTAKRVGGMREDEEAPAQKA